MGFVPGNQKEAIDSLLRGNALKERHSMLGVHFLDKANGSLELLLILDARKKQWSEKKWDAFVCDQVEEEWMVKVQAAQPVAKGQEGASCVSRLIAKNMSLAAMQPFLVSDKLFDGYKIASGGRMHDMDERPWRMKSSLLSELRREKLEHNSAIVMLKIKILEIAKEISKKNDVLDVAKQMVRAAGDDWLLSSQRYWLVEKIKDEIVDMESKELDVLEDINSLEKKIHSLEKILERQDYLKKREHNSSHQRSEKRRKIGCF